MYSKWLGNGVRIFLLLYVDDMLVASVDRQEVHRLKQQLASVFEMKDLGNTKKILGMQLLRDKAKGELRISQTDYLVRVLEKFCMDSAIPVSTPIAMQFKLSSQQCPKNEEEVNFMKKVPYASVVGSVMYSMICTRPDLTFASSLISRFMANPGKDHWCVVKWVLRYIRGIVDYGLLYEKREQYGDQLVGYCDSDFYGDLDRRRSSTGYCFTLFRNVVSWKSSLQSVVALSTTEAEFMALTEATKEALWLQGLIEEIGIKQAIVLIYCDSQGAIHLSKNQ